MVATQASLAHPNQHGDLPIHVVIYLHFRLAGLNAVEASGVLNQCSLPRNRKCKEQRIESGVVEALTDVPSSCEKKPCLIGRNGGERCKGLASLFCLH